MRPMCCVERAVAESVISALKRNDTAFARGQDRGLERRFDRFKTGIAKNRFRRSHHAEAHVVGIPADARVFQTRGRPLPGGERMDARRLQGLLPGSWRRVDRYSPSFKCDSA